MLKEFQNYEERPAAGDDIMEWLALAEKEVRRLFRERFYFERNQEVAGSPYFAQITEAIREMQVKLTELKHHGHEAESNALNECRDQGLT